MSFSDLKSPEGLSGNPRDDRSVSFSRYQMFPGLRLLLRDGHKVELGPRAFDVLWMLFEAGGELVSKYEIIDKVWAGVAVEENNLQAQMSAIRKALGRDRNLISTEFGRGYRLLAADRAQPSAEGAPAEAIAPPELPYPLTALVGRADELNDVEGLITGGRLVTITGPGGIGKTRLAVEVGHRLQSTSAGGVFLVEMGKIAEDDLVWPAIATGLLVPSASDGAVGRLPPSLHDKALLLIVDNCEHLAGAVAGAVEALLQNNRNLRVLATAQEPLGAEGEHVYRLAPLAVPATDSQGAEAAIAHGAVQLFVERASASAGQFDFSDAAAGDVCAICRRLDGMPLALELAAARVPMLGVQGVLAGLTDRFKLLTGGRRTALPRHRTLRATVDWSHTLLDEDERKLFRRLSVFAAEFTADAACYIGAPEYREPSQAFDILSSLVAKSLLQSDLSGPAPRYRFLETIRFYALEKLAESGEVTTTAARHAEFFAEVAKQASADWKQLSTEDWRQTYQTDIDDMRGALDWAFSDEGENQIGIDILSYSTPFWIQFSLHDECQRRLTHILDREEIDPAIQPAREMALRASLGTSLTWAKGPVKETGTAWSRALDLARRISDLETQLQAHYGLWLYNLRGGRYVESLGHATQLIELAEIAGDQEAIAAGQRIAGMSHHFLGRHAEARVLIETALRWYEQGRTAQAFRFGLDQQVAGLAFLSRILSVQGFSGDAIETASHSVEKARALDHACTLCCALAEGWCMVHALNGDDETVERAVVTLVHTASKHGLGFWKTYGDVFALWAAVRKTAGAIASDHLGSVITAVNDIHFDVGYSTLLTDLRLAFHQVGRDVPILATLAHEMMAKAGEDAHWAVPEFRRVEVKLASARDAASRGQLADALALAHRQGAHAWELKIAIDLAGALLEDNRRPEAASVLGPVLASFPDGRRSTHWRIAQAMELVS
jgi:predicted ATPase/DNA-binding winged helix-turn-helix (wHTH) protein